MKMLKCLLIIALTFIVVGWGPYSNPPPSTGGTGGIGDVVGGSTSTDSELPLYSGTGGKTLKRSNTLTGIPKLTSGVVSTATSGTDYAIPVTGAPADHASQGAIVTYTAGEAMSIGSVCYMGPDGKMWKAKGILPTARANDTVYAIGALVTPATYVNGGPFYFCSTAGTSHSAPPVYGTTIGGTTAEGGGTVVWTCIDYNSIRGHAMAVASIAAGDSGSFLMGGYVRDDSWTTQGPGGGALIKGQPIYMDKTTAGVFTQVRPNTVGDLIQVLGRCDAASATTLFFSPGDMTQK